MIKRFARLFMRQPSAECLELRDLSSDYIDGELDQETDDKVRSHLEWCALCQAFINTLKATVALLGSSDTPEPPASLAERIHERLQKEAGR